MSSTTKQPPRPAGYRRRLQMAVVAVILFAGATLPMAASGAALEFENGAGVTFGHGSFSIPLNVPNVDDRILVAGFMSISENFIDIVPTTFNLSGQELIHVGGIVQIEFTDFFARTDIYYLLNPSAGTQVLSATVNASNPTGFRQEVAWGGYGMVLSGARQVAPELLFTGAQNPNAPSSTIGGTVNTSENGAMLVGFTALNAGINNLFSTSGITEVYDVTFGGIINAGAAYKLAPLAGSQTFTWISNGFATGLGSAAIAQVLPAAIPVPGALYLLGPALFALCAGRRSAAG